MIKNIPLLLKFTDLKLQRKLKVIMGIFTDALLILHRSLLKSIKKYLHLNRKGFS